MARPANRTPAVEVWVAANPLRAWRKEQGLTIQDAAKLLGVTATSIGLWETGQRYPSDTTWRRWKRNLDPAVWEHLPTPSAINAWLHTAPGRKT